MRVVDLRAEYCTDLLGTEVRRPRLSWRLDGFTQQYGYRIMAAESVEQLAGRELLWDSGLVSSDAMFDIPWDGPPLRSMQRIWWMVSVTGNSGEAQSEPAWFETGVLERDEWRGQWIEAEDELAAADRAIGVPWLWGEKSLDPRPHAFRLDFEAPADLVAADIFLSGKDHLRGVWINGAASALDRPFGWDSHLPFWGTLTRFEGPVRAGPNSICALVEADTSGFFPVDGGAFAALIRLHRADGSILRLGGQAFRVMPDAPDGWTAEAFDASSWPAVRPSTSWAAGDPRPAEPAMLLRSTFTVERPVSTARLYATALGAYTARINVEPVSDSILAPEMSVANSHILYQVTDVTRLIAQGPNALAAMVGDGCYASPFGWRIERYGFGPAPRRFCAMLRIDYADGSTDWVETGPDWRMSPSAVLLSEIYDGESCDARLAQPGWDRPDFDNAGWRDVSIGEAPPARLVAQTSPPIRRTGTRRALSITQPAPGRYLFDFGQNISGWARLRAAGPAGSSITLRFAELLHPDGTVDQSNLRLARATDRFILSGDGIEDYEPHFTYHGFRYVEVEGYPGTPTADDLLAVIVHSDCRLVGQITFPDAPLLQQIYDNTLWSQRSNFFGVPTDCPQRDERMGWMGDIQIFADAAAFIMEVDPFIRRFLAEARAAQRPDGAYPIVVPQPLSYPDVVTAGWSEAGIILPWQLWQRYGDTAVIEENWAAMERWMAFVARSNPDHVWRNDRGLDLGDWLSVDAQKPDDETTPRMLCATAYWARSAALMADMAEASGRPADAARYRALRTAIGAAYAAEFIAGDGRCGNGSQTSQILSLAYDLVPEHQRADAAQHLAADIRQRGMTLSTGFLGTPHLLDVLADAGHLDEVAGLLLQTRYPSWGYMPERGATTIWERWNGDTGDIAMNSYNHYAFGAVVGFFFRRLAGIAPAVPGFRRIAVRPLWLPTVGRVMARHEAVVGVIETAIDGDADGMNRLELTVPANCMAEVELPDCADPSRPWCLHGKALDQTSQLPAAVLQNRLIQCEVGPGRHIFTR